MARNNKYQMSFDGLKDVINKYEQLQKEETMRKIRDEGLKAGFHCIQESLKANYHHKGRKVGTDDKPKLNTYYIIHNDTPLSRGKGKSTIGVGFVFDNSIPPLSPNARGGVIGQYLMYGTTVFGTPRVAADKQLYMALLGSSIRKKANQAIEDKAFEEISKLLTEK